MIPLKFQQTGGIARSVAASLLALLLLSACGADAPVEEAGVTLVTPPDEAGLPVMVWAPAGTLEERNVLREKIHDFNTTQNEIQVDLRIVSGDAYDDEVQAAALSGHLPDLIQLDAPNLYKNISLGHLVPLDDLLPTGLRDDLLPSVIQQGTFEGRLYSVSVSETGIGLYLNPSALYGVDTRLPRSVRTAWTAEEFDDLLRTLHERNGGQPVLDLKLNYTDGWLAHIFAPLLMSAGAGLLDLETQRAEGIVNGEAAVRAMTLIQSWFKNGYVDPNEDDDAFASGRVAFSWTGHWDFPAYDRALDGGFGIVPVPNFGAGSRTAHGSPSWAITRDARHPEATMRFLEFMLQPERILQLTNATGAVPARRSTIGLSSHYGVDMKLNMFAQQLEGGFATRPRTPAMEEIASAFGAAIEEIRNGADVQTTLDLLAENIDRHIAEHNGSHRIE